MCTGFHPGKIADGLVNLGRGASFGLTGKIADALSPGASCTVSSSGFQAEVLQELGRQADYVIGGAIATAIARRLALRLPYELVDNLKKGVRGATDSVGNIQVRAGQTAEAERETRLHEAVHSVYSRVFGVAISQGTYRTVIGARIEEFVAQMFATGDPIGSFKLARQYP